MSATGFAPLRNLQDIEELERVPLEQRLLSWNANDWIMRGLDLAPSKVAIRYIEDGDPESPATIVTYRELKQKTIAAANLFHSLGVGPDDAVLYLMPTTPQLYTVMLGSIAAGVSCCTNWMLEPEHWAALIRSSRAKVVVALGPTPGYDIWDKLQSVAGELPTGVTILSVQGTGGRQLPESDLDLLAARQPKDALTFSRKTTPDDVAAYVHSGGTTGAPKLVKLTHRGFSYKFWANTLVMAHTADEVIFADYPMFHVAGFFGRGIMAVADGMEIVIPSPIGARDKRFIENYWKFVEKFRITMLSGVPTTLAQLSKSPPAGQDLSSLRPYGVTGSTAFPAEVARQLQNICNVRMLASYGATEYTQNVAQPPRDGDPRYGSAGLRLPYTQIKIVEIGDGGHIKRECATDEIGLVVVKGPSVTPGYVDESYNAGILLPDGWFNSGDLGRLDADGFLWITGRAKDVIIRGGHNIDPTVIEETLLKHPEVMLAAAVSKPDAYAGELPIAYVQLVPNAKATADEVQAFALAHSTERAAAPKEIILVEKMPLTDVGKPAKVQLRLDAAKRAFTTALADVAGGGPVSVSMVPDPKQGHRAAIQVAAGAGASRQQVEDNIRERMKYYSTPYEIVWTAA
ncbi:MAG: acyl-CoA synthetase [Alphaproteobacteria bacterium]|nr:acyl-CoA synthetase [Alphaproteobacteria bacterium]